MCSLATAMTPRSGLLLRVLVLFLLAFMALSPVACVGCSSDSPSVREAVETAFPERVDEVFLSDDAFVRTADGDYAAPRDDERLKATISADPPHEIRLESADGFKVQLRPGNDRLHSGIVDGAVIYEFEGGAEIWTARNDRYELTLFLEHGSNESFEWSWEIAGATLRQHDDEVVFLDEQQRSRLSLRVVNAQAASSEPVAVAVSVTDSSVSLQLPSISSARLVRLVLTAKTTEADAATNPPDPISIACITDMDCYSSPFIFICDNNQCKVRTGQPCPFIEPCQSGQCVDGFCCESACTEECKSCNQPGSLGLCVNVPANIEDPNSMCTLPRFCNGNGVCLRTDGSTCSDFSQCLSGYCVDGTCCNTPCQNQCHACNLAGNMGTCSPVPSGVTDPVSSIPCTNPFACDGVGQCKKINGQPCSLGTECLSTICVDMVCCDSGCGETCKACTSAKTGVATGTCAFITGGTDPDNECVQQPISSCGTTGMCNGTGACSVYANNTVCSPATCTDSVTLQNADLCDGTGSCVDKSTTNCSPYLCSGTACLTTCSTNMQCVSGAYCDTAMMKCVTKKANGSTCASVLECQSNFCVDGYCCDAVCSGTCLSCAQAGGQGTCLPVAAGQNDNTCQGANQACDGTGSCKKAIGQSCAVATECTSNACVDGYCCDTTCTGDCQACSIAKKGAGNQKGNGYCENVASGTDPNNNCMAEPVTSCGNNGFCDGMGQCQKFSTSTICAAPSCLDGDTLKGPNLCDGNGFCAIGETECAPFICKTNACKTTCASNMDCIADAYCEMTACLPKKLDGQPCANAGQCQNGQCVDSVCCATAMCPDCQACNLSGNGTCSPVPAGNKDGLCSTVDKACDGLGVCKKINGQSCAANPECVTENCVDGVCCNTSCKTPCQACNVAGNVGICSNVPSGQDDSTCTGSDVACDGNGECKKELGQTCSAPTECLVGKCVDGVCCNTDCPETCKACNLPNSLGLCSFVPENNKDPMTCDTSSVSCNGAGECVKSLGEACAMDGECSSKHCTDGVCCDVECGIDCQSCNVQGSIGICTDVPAKQTDGACMNGKACNGSGKCMIEIGQKCGVGTQCLSGFCFNQVCCDAACSGNCQACSIATGATADGVCTALSDKPCDDGNFCTQTDVCQSGTCVGDNPVVCAEAGDCQNEGLCNPTSGICEYSDQGPECTAGKNTTGGGCVCSFLGARTSNREALVGIAGLVVAMAFRKRNKSAKPQVRA